MECSRRDTTEGDSTARTRARTSSRIPKVGVVRVEISAVERSIGFTIAVTEKAPTRGPC